MKTKLYLILIMLFTFGCEDTDVTSELSLLGTWNVTSSKSYENLECTGVFENVLDSTIALIGDSFLQTLTVSETQAVMGFEALLTSSDLCDQINGTLVGDSCVSEYYQLSVSLDTLCANFDGTLTSNGCSLSQSDSLGLLILDGMTLQLIEHAGTDSADVMSLSYLLTETTLTLTETGTEEADEEEEEGGPYCEVLELTKQ